LEALRTEILQVIGKHVAVDSENVKVSVDRREAVAMLTIDIEIRAPSEALLTEAPAKGCLTSSSAGFVRNPC
jgi:hypothetical protein